jgi:DMSO reductase anchor subunit
LIFMLVLTQLGIGLECAALLLRLLDPGMASALNPFLVPVGLGAVLAGLGIGAAHLGQPLRAWRAFLGVRTSWLSREFIAFGLLVPALAAHTLLEWGAGPMSRALGFHLADGASWLTGAHVAAVALGGVALACSMMIYHDTGRPSWRLAITGTQFAGTSVLLGMAAAWAVGAAYAHGAGVMTAFHFNHALSWAGWIVPVTLLKVLAETSLGSLCGLSRTRTFHVRMMAGLTGGVALPAGYIAASLLAPASTIPGPWIALASFLLLTVGEIAERYLFFTEVRFPRMPRGSE